MKKYEDIKTAICPKCGQEYTGRPALSRADNKTMICPDCGIHEALENIGVGKEEQNERERQIILKQLQPTDGLSRPYGSRSGITKINRSERTKYYENKNLRSIRLKH